MNTLSSQGGHSAQVKMHLLVNGAAIPVAQMGPDYVILDQPVNHPPGKAHVILKVDQSERKWSVRMPDGVSANSKRVALALGE